MSRLTTKVKKEIVKQYEIVGFEVLTAVVMKSTIVRDITLYSPLKVN
jgi:hypothetical protein